MLRKVVLRKREFTEDFLFTNFIGIWLCPKGHGLFLCPKGAGTNYKAFFWAGDAGKERHIIMQAKGWHYARYP